MPSQPLSASATFSRLGTDSALIRRKELNLFIRHAPPVQAKSFVSYRRDDSLDATGRIYDRLQKEFGDGSVFRDLDSMPFGVDFRDHIDKRLADCDVCIVVIGNKFLTVPDKSGARRIDDPRDHVRIEIETALKRNIRVVPLLVGT